MNKTINIDGCAIGEGHPPYIIAEMSANHNGNIEQAFEIITQAKKAGANAVKIQTYTADTLTIDSTLSDFQIESGLWQGKTLYELYEWAHTPWDWHSELFAKAMELGITMFSSPFDSTAVDLLEDLNAPAYKIASFEAIDLPLIKYAAETKKPMIISTGMANHEEIAEAIDTALSAGCTELVILHCVSAYPATASAYNLATIPDMKSEFDVLVGLSDHTLDNTVAIASVSMGACVIEKHFTLDRSAGGPDDSFSLEPSQLAALVADATLAWQAVGKPNYERAEGESENMKFRRSLYFVADKQAGDIVKPGDIRSIRPGFGLAPKHQESLLGRKLNKSASRGTAVSWDFFD